MGKLHIQAEKIEESSIVPDLSENIDYKDPVKPIRSKKLSTPVHLLLNIGFPMFGTMSLMIFCYKALKNAQDKLTEAKGINRKSEEKLKKYKEIKIHQGKTLVLNSDLLSRINELEVENKELRDKNTELHAENNTLLVNKKLYDQFINGLKDAQKELQTTMKKIEDEYNKNKTHPAATYLGEYIEKIVQRIVTQEPIMKQMSSEIKQEHNKMMENLSKELQTFANNLLNEHQKTATQLLKDKLKKFDKLETDLNNRIQEYDKATEQLKQQMKKPKPKP